MRIVLGVLTGILFLVAAAFLPLPLRPYLDFQVLYHANLGLLRGIPIYDHAGQVNMIAELAHVSPSQVFVLPFPYPPWYVQSTLWLALFPIDIAARLWFGFSLILFTIALWVLTNGWDVTKRLPAAFFALIFPPVLGSLFVGQYGFPVLLGTALLFRALQRKDAFLCGLASALLTLKPHLGIPILLIVLVYLWNQRDRFRRKALWALAIAGMLLFTLGFLASPVWPLDYFHSLTGFKDVSQCHQCASLPMVLAGLIGGSFDQAIYFALLLCLILGSWLAWRWGRLTESANRLIVSGTLTVFMVSPYLQNYDYILLLVPLILLAEDARDVDWVWLGVAYVLPITALAVYGTKGNTTLPLSAVILFIHAVLRFNNGQQSKSIPLPREQ